jgi:hypothetical protein
VRPGEAEDLWRLLCSGYPRSKPTDETKGLWLSRLRSLDAVLGAAAIESVIDGVRFWPSMAEFHEHVQIIREQKARARREEERRVADELADNLPRPPLSEIPSVQKLLGRWSVVSGLENAEPGECDDCHREAQMRFVLGPLVLCRECATRRRRAGLIAEGRAKPRGVPRQRDPFQRERIRANAQPPIRDASRRRTTCRLCGKELRTYEQPEGECDDCLRGRSSRSYAAEQDKRHNDAADGGKGGMP